MFRPRLWECWTSCTWQQIGTDMLAGVVVGIVALPLAMAFGIASGVTPEKGLYTAIIAGLLISALGGSRVQIGGPTGAFVVLVFEIVQNHGLDGLAVCTFMAGLIVLFMGVFRLGAMIKYIPYPVITGFTSGIAVIIFSSQIKDLLGLTTGKLPGDVAGKWAVYLQNLATINWSAVTIAIMCIGIIVILRKYYPRVPATLIAMVAATALVQMTGMNVETIGSRFGDLPNGLPRPELPHLSLSRCMELLGPAVGVALLAAIESLLSAVVSDGMIGDRHDPNQELIAQGIANLFSPLFGGIPATGAIARTTVNIKSGGRTPIAGMTHALTLLLILVSLGRWGRLIPLASLAAILVIVAYHMSEWRAFRSLFRAPPRDIIVLLTTFTLTVVVDLSVAVQAGVGLAALLFVKRMADATRIQPLKVVDGAAEVLPDEAWDRKSIPSGAEVYEVQGPLFFGAADKLRNTLPIHSRSPRVMILNLRAVPLVDATGLHTLAEFHKACQARGSELILAAVQPGVRHKLKRWPASKTLTSQNVVGSMREAIERAQVLLTLPPIVGEDNRHIA